MPQILNMERKLLFFFLITLFYTNANANPPIEEGKAIFTSRCAGCHNVNKLLVGPALAGVDKRHSMDWIVNFVQSSQTVIKSGDKKANELFTKFNKIQMPDHKDLTADNIKNVVEFIRSSAAEESKAAPAPVTTKTGNKLFAITNFQFIIICVPLMLLLIASLVLLIKVKQLQGLKAKQ